MTISNIPDLPTLTLKPIGIFRSDKKYPYETASQGSLDQSGERALIDLLPGKNFEQAVRGISKMSHIWVIFGFHQNENWKPIVTVPRGSIDKQGVFATRSPHRPNPLGLSLVEVLDVTERQIWVKNFDLLDGTPILDIKPFHPEADVPINPKFGWMENLNQDQYVVLTTPEFDKRAQYLHGNGVKQITPFCSQQLRFDPFNAEKKRVKMESDTNRGVLAYRTWRILFFHREMIIRLDRIFSGYTNEDLKNREDKWKDKALHREFNAIFGRDLESPTD